MKPSIIGINVLDGITAQESQEVIAYTDESSQQKRMGASFFRGEGVSFNPYARDFDKPTFLQDYILAGWLPDGPMIQKDTCVTAFGSCFARHITDHLSAIGYSVSRDRNPNIYISTMGEGLVNTFAILQQLEWALEGISPPTGLWHGYKAEEYGYDLAIQNSTREIFLGTDFFIITLGLSEVWYDEPTGGVFWRAVPQVKYDKGRHKFRVASFSETKACIARIDSLIRIHVPTAKILFTLSPIPLAATFRPVSCLTANSASKAILRAALDEFFRENLADVNQRLFYFPSYEIVTELFFSRFTEDGRHPHNEITSLIMRLFEAIYCDNSLALHTVEEDYKRLREINRLRLGKISSAD